MTAPLSDERLDALVADLRDRAHKYDEYAWHGDCELAAADAITQLRARLAEGERERRILDNLHQVVQTQNEKLLVLWHNADRSGFERWREAAAKVCETAAAEYHRRAQKLVLRNLDLANFLRGKGAAANMCAEQIEALPYSPPATDAKKP